MIFTRKMSVQKKNEYSFASIFVFTMDDPVQYRSQHIFTLNRFPISKAFDIQTQINGEIIFGLGKLYLFINHIKSKISSATRFTILFLKFEKLPFLN